MKHLVRRAGVRTALIVTTAASTAAATLLAFAPPASAVSSVLYVSQTGNNTANNCAVAASPCATITYALGQAANGATINVSGTIHDNVVMGAHSGITITGVNAPGGAPAVIDGSGTGSVFSTDVDLNLDHLTVQNGHNTDSLGGGAVQNSYATVQLSNVTVTANSSDTNAGGVESTGTLTISDSTISGNTSNGGYGGGGIHVFSGSAQISNSTISGNHSAGDGGGIMIGAYHPSFFGNVTITGSTLSGNSSGASDRGGAINDSAYSTLTVNTSTITGNTAGFGAGIEVAPSASATVRSSTIAINKGSFGAGIDSTSGAVTVAGSIVAGNYFNDCDRSGGTWAVSYSLVSAGGCGTGTGVVNADPMLAPLADNGGPTKTLALSLASAAADAIPVGTTVNGVQLCSRTDQTGTAAPLASQAACSMGAVEATAVQPALFNVLYVASGGSNASNNCTLKASPCATVTYAISQVPSLVGAVTIKVSGQINDNIDVPANRPYTISGAGAASPAVIDGSSITAVVYNDAGANFRLEYLTLQHGSVTGYGGGLSFLNGSVALSHLTITNNTSAKGGGGIFAGGGTVTIADSVISNNTTGSCGGCLNMYGGGGIAVYQGANMTITRSTISGNTSEGGGNGSGGGISMTGAPPLTITDSTITGNTATHQGGGIIAETATIINSTITGNTANTNGGGIYGVGNSNVTVTGSTIAGNTATSFSGGGARIDLGGTLTYGATIFSGNFNGNCSVASSPPSFGSVVTVGYNVDSDNSCGLAVTGDVKGVNANLGALTANGGPTLTMLPNAGSPAIGKIPVGTTLNSVTACARKDQRGLSGPSAGQTLCTIGAVEVAAGAAPAFTSASGTSVPGGTRFTFAVTTNSIVVPVLTVSSGTPLPTGVSFTDNGDGTGTLSGFTTPGTYPFTLQAANGTGPGVTQSFTLTVVKRNQQPLSVTSLSGSYGTPLTLTSSGGSGTGAVSYSATNGTATGCDATGTTLTSTSAGTCTVTVSKAADANFLIASSPPTAVTLGKADQAALTVTSTSGTYATPLTLTTSGGSGTGAVTYVAANGTATGCAVNGTTLTSTSAGTCTVTATKAADANYNAKSSAPTTVTLAKASQAALTVTSTSGTYLTPLTLTTSGGSGTGSVTYVAANGTATGCDASGSTLTSTSAGTCTVTATKAADANYTVVSSAPTTVTLAKAAQATLTVTSTSGTYGTPLTLTTAGGSGTGAVTYVAVNGTATGCAVNQTSLTSTSAGTCTVTATKAADANYSAVSSAPTTVTFAKRAQATLTVTSTSGSYNSPLHLTTSGGSGTGTVSYSAADGTASGCVVNGDFLSSTSAGTCTVTATKAADQNYLEQSSVPTTVTFAKIAQAPLSLTSLAGTFGTPLTLTTSGGSGSGAVTFAVVDGTASGCVVAGSSLTSSSAGTCTVTATKAADTNYTATASDPTTVTIVKGGQTIEFTSTAPDPAYVGGPAYTVTASGGASGNAVTFALDDLSTGCALSGAELTFTATGTCLVDADQAGNANYDPAAQATQSFTIATDAVAPAVKLTAPAATTATSMPTTLTGKAAVTWTGSDSGSGVGTYQVRWARAAYTGGLGAWTYPAAWTALAGTTVTQTGLAKGYVYCYSVQARDKVGNLSSWSANRCVAVPLDDGSLSAVTSGWTRVSSASYWGGTAEKSKTRNAALSRAGAQLSRVGLVATRCPTCGQVGIYVNGTLIGKINLSASTTQYRKVLMLPAFSLRKGTVTVKVLTSNKPVFIDGLVISRF